MEKEPLPMKAANAYRSLNDEQKQIVDNKTVDLDHTAAEMIALLEPVAALDKLVGSAKTQLGCSIVLLAVAAIASLFVAPFPYNFIVVAACIGGIIWVVRSLKLARNLDCSDNLGAFAVPLLKLMRDDFKPDEPVHLHLDLRLPTCKEKFVSKGEPYKQGGYYKIIDTIYKDSWFSGEGVLNDGSRFRWSIEDTIRESQKSKRTARGKYKTKTKYKKKSDIDVELVLRKKTYAVDGAAKESEKSATMRASRKFVQPSNDPIPLDPFVELVGGIYKAAKPAQ
jgi:hypothetical protein